MIPTRNPLRSCAVSIALLLAAWLTILPPVDAQDLLKRRADWGMGLRPPADAGGATVAVVRPGGAAERAGVRVQDRLLSVNGVSAADPAAFLRTYRALRGGDAARFEVARGNERLVLSFASDPLAQEKIAGVTVEYGSVVSDRGHRVRTVVTRPEGVAGRLPAIVFIPWLSCSPIEHPRPNEDGWMRMLHEAAASSGALMMRVEKPGVGDSEGPPCGQNALDDDLAAYRAGIRAALARADVDPNRLVLFGGSIGAALAPVLAAEFPVRGLIVTGGFSRTWLEHMLGNERRRLVLLGKSPSEINAAMRGFATLYDLYLNEKLTPAEVLARKPELKPLWTNGPEHQYGRHVRYFHGVQALDVEGAWAQVKVPTLIVWGEHDWIMGREDQDRIVQIVSARDPKLVQLRVIEKMNHHFDVYPSPKAAFEEEGGKYTREPAQLIARWIKEQAARQFARDARSEPLELRRVRPREPRHHLVGKARALGDRGFPIAHAPRVVDAIAVEVVSVGQLAVRQPRQQRG